MGFGLDDIIPPSVSKPFRALSDASGLGIPLEAYNEFSKGGLYGQNSTLGYGLDQMMNPNIPNPADSAMGYLNQIPGQLKGIYDEQKGLYNPYMQQGQSAYGQINPIYNSMASDPATYLEKMMSSYQPSKAYQLQKEEALRAAGNSAAAGGMRGTASDASSQAKITDALLGQDMQTWLGNVTGLQGRGLQGLGNFYDTGFNAAGRLGQAGQAYGSDLSNVFGTKAQLAFQGQAQQNQADSDRRNMWVKMIGGLAGGGIGAFAGGPAGASIGSGVGSGLGGSMGGGGGGYSGGGAGNYNLGLWS